MKLSTRFGIALALCLSAIPAMAADKPAGMEKIRHIVVIYLENRSFDHLYGLFPGANGLSNAGAAAMQTTATASPTPRCRRRC